MKSRSHRVPNSDPPDDWVDGSWTVDCICGVNFDDGEEMVNCDECGVWVHTRCSRFVKGEKSFACDKCKSKESNNNDNYINHNSNGNNSSKNDAEETEVAQLLVELPLKTIKMSNNTSHPLNHPPPHRPRPWSERPMDDRVHIQGVPGGDPALFQGLSSIFTSELWKCTGYVPKKFNFCYKEFPCWDQQLDDDGNVEEDNKKMANNGAGVLCSLSKETLLTSPTVAVVDIREHGVSERKSVKEKKSEHGESIVKGLQDSKNKGHDLGPSKDRNVKRKSKVIDRETDVKKKRAHALKTAVTFPSDARLSDDKDARVTEADFQVKLGLGEADKVQEAAFDASLPSGRGGDKIKHCAAGDNILEALSSEMPECNYSTSKGDKIGRAGHVAVIHEDHSPKMSDVLPLLEYNDDGSSVLIGEKLKSLVADTANASIGVKCDQNLKSPKVDMSPSSSHPNHKSVIDAADTNPLKYSSDAVVKTDDRKDLSQSQVSYADLRSENSNVNDTAVGTSLPSEHKLQEFHQSSKVGSDHKVKKSVEVPDKQEANQSECSLETHKAHGEAKQGSQSAETTSELGEAGAPQAYATQHKLVCVGKSSGSSTIVISKSCASDKSRISSSQNANPFSKQDFTNSIVSSKRDDPDDLVRDDDKLQMLQKTIKDQPNSLADAASKMLHPSRVSHAPTKSTSVEAKDPVKNRSLRTSSAENCESPSSIDDCTVPMQTPEALHVPNKSPVSTFPSKSEKVPPPNSQSSSKAGYSSLGQTTVSSNTATGLSDEELALLLHQELNSSPRVPRVPRVRHAGSLPQLSSASATSLLIKRTSGSGGKDQYLSSRRKNKEVHDSEAKRTSRLPSSPDSAKTSDALTEVEANNDLHYSRKSSANVSVASGGPSSSNDVNEHNLSSLRISPRNNSDEDTGTKGPVHRTLPGLIAEIMSKGRRMTHVELCNAVRPHWRNLRKHNGERYAYSSHSQAVLDCLRNRTEWASLVDRGPKTSVSRKRRKIDDEPPNAEVKGSDFCKDRTLKDVEGKRVHSSREKFPKGKRKARKRRRLAVQGKGMKDARKRRKAEVVSDDDDDDGSGSDSASNSSEGTGYSEGESQGGGAAGTEPSTSSYETATMS